MELAEKMFVPMVRLEVVREKSLAYCYEKTMSNPKQVANWIKPLMQNCDREILVVISTDAQCHPVAVEVVSIGDMVSTIATTSQIFKHALVSNAFGIIVVHNHPSFGPVTPSEDDRKVTKNIQAASKLLGVALFDSIIIGGNGSVVSILEENGRN